MLTTRPLDHYAIDKCMLFTPLADTHTQIIIFARSFTQLTFIHTLVIPSESDRLIFVSSDQITSFQNLRSLSRCSSTNQTLSSRFLVPTKGLFLVFLIMEAMEATNGELFGYSFGFFSILLTILLFYFLGPFFKDPVYLNL